MLTWAWLWLTASWLATAVLAGVGLTAVWRLRRQRKHLAMLVACLDMSHSSALRYAEELQRQVMEDRLTGLRNRRFMDTDLPRELERARRFDRELTLAMVDVDGFKRINDRFSHQLGDRVLTELAGLLRQECRTVDGVVRYGGDEFVLYFPETRLTAGRSICERLIDKVRTHPWEQLAPGLRVALSIGVASTRGQTSVEALLEAADERLRAAKRAGKNRVLVLGPALAQPHVA